MANKIFFLGLFLLSVANVKAQTQTQNDSLTMENMMHNLPEIILKGILYCPYFTFLSYIIFL